MKDTLFVGLDVHEERISIAVAKCDVVAPGLVPQKAGDRVKTDCRDAQKLTHHLRNGELKPVWVPNELHEALRDLIRPREGAKDDLRI